jgi:glycosyltransferase involved in cell wall biosynthesis
LIFVSRLFYDKGGAAALEVMDKLTKNYDNVEGIIVSTTPSEMIELYKNNKKIKFLNLMSQEKLIKEVFSKADIFLYPGFFDTFGLAFLEAMALGLPIVTVDGFARKEIVENGKDGFIIYRPKNLDIKNVKKHSDMINQLVEKTAQLIDNKNLREKMGKNGMKKILSGKFSLIQRNKKLIKIYEEALEN